MAATSRKRPQGAPSWLAATVLPVLAFAAYWRTLAPGLTFGDCGDLVVAAYQLGVPHPTGYPLYTMLGHLWIAVVRHGDVAWRMNLLSAVCGALAVGVLYRCMVSLMLSARAAFLAAGAFAVSTTFWSNANVTEVYTLHALLVALVLLALVRFSEQPSAKTGAWLVILYGLTLTHHLIAVWLLPGIVFAVAYQGYKQRGSLRPMRWAWLGLVPLVLYVYLPWAALRDAPYNWGDPRTPGRFFAHVTGRLYRERMGQLSPQALGTRLKGYLGLSGGTDYAASQQYPAVILWLAPIGAGVLLQRRFQVGLAVLLFYAGTLLWALSYSIRDIEPYFLTAHMITTLWIAQGFDAVMEWVGLAQTTRRSIALGITAVAVGVPIVLGAANVRSVDRSQDRTAPQQTRALLSRLPQRALVVLSGDAWGFPVAYHCYVLGERRDLRLLFYRDFLAPEYQRLVERERARGLRIPSRPAEPGLAGGMAWLRAILRANQPERPCYLVGNAFGDMAAQGSLEETLGPVRMLAPRLPVFEVRRE